MMLAGARIREWVGEERRTGSLLKVRVTRHTDAFEGLC